MKNRAFIDLLNGLTQKQLDKEKKGMNPDDTAMYESVWGGSGGDPNCDHTTESLGVEGIKCIKCGKHWI